MKLFGKKKDNRIPVVQSDKYELVLRCSICNGEQILCTKDRETGEQQELMLIKSFDELKEVCEANHIDPTTVKKEF
ncbi:MAG: aspartate dehydrogenase [Lachnospiraceae bacterium]|nr:aspartate dehydrogenase [Lachnospiraceae bacterium]